MGDSARISNGFLEKRIFKTIGNKMGKFRMLEEEWETKVDRRCARILVELDLREGLFE